VHKSTVMKVLFATALVVMLVWATQPVLAQRGGHSGGGGFHGGGGGGGFHGGGGGFHGGGGGGGGFHGGAGGFQGGGGRYYATGGHYYGGYHGGHGGYYGGHGGYWGYPGFAFGFGYGSGWGFALSFGWGSYWPAYPYAYGYGAYPYYYPYSYYAPPTYVSVQPYASNQSVDNSYQYAPAAQSSVPVRVSPPSTGAATLQNAAYPPSTSSYGNGAANGVARNYAPVRSTTQQLSPEVQNVIRALRAMPPDARQRQIDSGRYSNLAPKELEFAKYAADLPATAAN
jgi:hypothetical protein